MPSVEIGRLLGNNPPKLARRGDNSLVLPETYLGLEFEVENCAFSENTILPRPLSAYWTIKKDGSLRNGGMEFVFTEPLFGQDVVQAVNAFIDYREKSQITTSIRTGMHVHLDMREVSLENLISFTALYTLLEPMIFKWVGNNREESIYCVPFYYSDEAIKQATSILTALIHDDILYQAAPESNRFTSKKVSDNFERYAGLNMQALGRFGSVEFRHMPMTFSKQLIMGWINIILAIKKESLAISPAELRSRISAGRLNVNSVVNSLGPAVRGVLGHIPVSREQSLRVCYSAQEILQVLDVRKWKSPNPRFYGENPLLAKNKANPPPVVMVPQELGPLAAAALAARRRGWDEEIRMAYGLGADPPAPAPVWIEDGIDDDLNNP